MINFCSLEAGNEVASVLQLLLVSFSSARFLGLALFYLFFLNWSLCFVCSCSVIALVLFDASCCCCCCFCCFSLIVLPCSCPLNGAVISFSVCYFNFSLLVSFAGWLDYLSSFACFLARLPACLLAWLLACLPACLLAFNVCVTLHVCLSFR